MLRGLFLVGLLGWASACAPSLKPEDDGGTGGGGPPGGAKIETTDNGDGTFTTVVDATSETDYVYFDFESQGEKTVELPLNSTDWDIGFRRHLIPTNGGISGPGGVMVAPLEGDLFAETTDAPTTGYLTDAEDPPEDGDEDPDFVFNAIETSWFRYNPSDHTLSPAERTYVVRTVEGRHYKFRVLDYYDAVGTAGHLTFSWGEIGPPSTPDSFTVDASGGIVYLSIAEGGAVSVSDPATSSTWDLALDANTLIRTNGGTSGAGFGGARVTDAETDYDALTSTSTVGFTVDSMIVPPGPPGQPDTSGHAEMNLWYDYDPKSHKVTTRGEIYVVRAADGTYGKFQIVYFADGVYELRLAPIARLVTDESSTIDASSDWTYFSFRLGEVVSPDDPATSGDWDLALNGLRLQTNSGTSGAGDGGALDPSETQLSDVLIAPASGYAADELLSIDDDDFSGSPVLNPWYETATTTPLDQAFLLRTADGGFVKLKIDGFGAGVYSIDWAYAGAGLMDFGDD